MKKQSHLVDLVCLKTADMVCTVFRQRLLYFHVRCMQQGASRLIDDRWMEMSVMSSASHDDVQPPCDTRVMEQIFCRLAGSLSGKPVAF